MKLAFWQKKNKKEIEALRNQMLSDKGDEVAMWRAANAEIQKITEMMCERNAKKAGRVERKYV